LEYSAENYGKKYRGNGDIFSLMIAMITNGM